MQTPLLNVSGWSGGTALPPDFWWDSQTVATWPSSTAANIPVCPRCHGAHALAQCPQVKTIEYYKDGSIRRVEFFETVGSRPIGPVTVEVGGGSCE
jgi:hypothetical protein